MEIEFSALYLTLIFMLLLLKLGSIFRNNTSNSHLPPGPWKLPIIGNMHQLVGSLPHRSLRDLAKKYGPIMQLQLGEVSTVVVSSPETAKEVMKTQDIIFASRPHIIATEIMSYNSTNIAFAPYGEYWRQLRKLCILKLLSTSRIRSFRYIREEETSNLIKWIACNAGSPINLTEKIYSSASTTISRAAFGKKNEEQETFIYVLKESIKLAAGFNIADIYPSVKFLHLISGVKPKLERLHRKADKILENIINEHRIDRATTNTCELESHKDLVDILLKYQQDENLELSLTVDNIKAVLLAESIKDASSPKGSRMCKNSNPWPATRVVIFKAHEKKSGMIFRSNTSTSRPPPGPWKLPLIGNMHQLAGSLPHRALRDLAKKYGPLMLLQLGEVSTIVVSSPETAKEVMKTHDIVFASRPHIIATEIMSYNSTNIAFAPYGEYWRQLRKLCILELLSTSRVRSFRYIREEESSNLITWIASNAGSIINLTENIYSSTSTTISRAALGKKSMEQETLIYVLKESIKLAAGFNIADIYPSIKFLHLISGVKPKLERLRMKADRILDSIINEHRIGSNTSIDEPEAHKDLVDVLLKYQNDGSLDFSLTDDNIKAVIMVSDLYINCLIVL
ncbi:hypothetical protein ACH5RR_038049 [Cinchona calisaya]|uniref:Cytochrome P450 n=1 Tax=Cinchona calisaya TaxID=153742 RepID=A0ABD2Y931_9GENT